MLNLGPFGQIGVSTYTIITLGFALRDENQEAVVPLLEKASNEIVLSYPWLAGQVVNEKSPDEKEPSSGTYKVVSYKPHEITSKFVHVKDCRTLCPNYPDIVKARAPISMLDGAILTPPAYAFPFMYPSHVTQPFGHHQTMDANGHEQFLRQFARLLCCEKLLEEHVRIGNIDQQTIVPPLGAGEVPNAMEMYRCASTLNDPPAGAWPPPGSGETWKMFRFPAAKVAALKVEASKDLLSSDLEYVSTDDAVTTFIWKHLTAVRSKIVPNASQAMLLRCVNGRKRLVPSVSERYMGHSILLAFTTLPIEQLRDDSLASTAIKLRKSVLEVNDHQVRSLFGLLKAEKDITTFNYGAKANIEIDVLFASFVGQKLYHTSFGDVLGMPDFIRRPKLPDGPFLCYLLPKTSDGDIDTVVGLSGEEYEAFKSNARWMEYAEVIE